MNESAYRSSEPKEITISGVKFRIREMTGPEYDAASNEYMGIDDDGRFTIDLAKRNAAWLRLCVVDADIEFAVSMGATGTAKKFVDLDAGEKIAALQNLKPGIRLKLLQEIRVLNEVSREVAKN